MFRRAEKKKAYLRLALCGVSGSGKTYSALKIAFGMGGKIAVLDTENRSSQLYSKLGEYYTEDLTPPFSTDRYIEIIKQAEKAGYDILIIDSLSHAWFAEGGVLDTVDKITESSQPKNSYMSWNKGTSIHNKLIQAILNSKMHIIATMRSKQAHDLVKGNNGKLTPVKMGLAPIQREGVDYEFTIVFDLAHPSNLASVSKDRTGLFNEKIFVPSEETGRQLIEWLNSGVDLADVAAKFITNFDKSETLEELNVLLSESKNQSFSNDDDLMKNILDAYNVKKHEFLKINAQYFIEKMYKAENLEEAAIIYKNFHIEGCNAYKDLQEDMVKAKDERKAYFQRVELEKQIKELDEKREIERLAKKEEEIDATTFVNRVVEKHLSNSSVQNAEF